MRGALAAMLEERRRLGDAGGVDLRTIVDDLLSGEVAAPTADVAFLVKHHTDPGSFYEYPGDPIASGVGTPVSHTEPA